MTFSECNVRPPAADCDSSKAGRHTRRTTNLANGDTMLPRGDRVRYEQIRKDLREHDATTGRRNAEELGWWLTILVGSSAAGSWRE